MKRKMIIAVTAFLLFILCILIVTYYPKRNIDEPVDNYNFDYSTCMNYKVLDNYGLPGHERFRTILHRENTFAQYVKLLEEFNSADNFRYIEAYDVLLQYVGSYQNGNSFIPGYGTLPEEELETFINQRAKAEDGSIISITNIKGALISGKAFTEDLSLQDHIFRGNVFSASDFLYNGNRIPVLLGYDYLDLYQIGDEITVLYAGYPVELKVIGFLDDTSSVHIGSTDISLDTYMVLPSFDIEAEYAKNNQIFSNLHYSHKTRGFFTVTKNVEEAVDEFEEIIEKSGLDYVYIPLPE
ncbi:hypothetical protein [Eisenbergiella sp.]